MPFPKYLVIINKYITNRFILLFAGWISPLAIVEHRGRKSEKLYRTPVLAFPTKDGFVFALTYGRDVDWVKNLLKHNFGILKYKGAKNTIQGFSFKPYEKMKESFPVLVRFFLNKILVNECLLAAKQNNRNIVFSF